MASLPRHFSKQPLRAEAERNEHREVENSLDLGGEMPGREIIGVPEDAEAEEKLGLIEVSVDRRDSVNGSLELVRQGRNRAGERDKVMVDRAGTGA